MSLAAMVLADRGERLIRFYDTWIGVITHGRDARVRSAVIDQIAPGERLLDIGCGTGTLAVTAARAGARVVGIDRSAGMLAVAQEKANRAGVQVDLRPGDAARPPIEGEQFDVVTATFVLGELSDELAAIAVRRMAEALRPGGRLIVADEVVPDAPLPRVIGSVVRAALAVGSFLFLQQLAPTRRHAWRALLAEAGLEVTSETAAGTGGLVILTAIRGSDLPPIHREIRELADVLPDGVRGALLRAGAWMDLPIAVPSGVYRHGEPAAAGPVLLTGNFLGSVEAVRTGLGTSSALVAIEDSDGWNVWCASDAGRFTAEKAAGLLELYGVGDLVERHRIVVPRLGGRVRRPLAALTGWEVVVGPIEARDIPQFLAEGLTPEMHSLDRLYRLRERIRVAALTLVQLPLFLLPLRWLPVRARRPTLRFAVAAGCVLPLAHDQLPGRTGIAKATGLGAVAALLGLLGRRIRPSAALAILVSAPLVGWVYQSSSPVVFWKRFWR